MSSPFISVVVPVHNEEKYLGGCLDALLGQDYPAGRREIIVVDNKSTDGSVALAEARGVTVLRAVGGTISAVRNEGARIARGEIIAFTDGDCVVPSHWLSEARAVLDSDPSIGATGYYYTGLPPGAGWIPRTWALVSNKRDIAGRAAGGDGIVESPWFPGGDLIVRRSCFEAVGGFDEGLMTAEDWMFCKCVWEAGYRIAGTRRLGVQHLKEPSSLSGFFRRERWRGMHVVRLFRREPRRLLGLFPLLLGAYTLGASGTVALLLLPPLGSVVAVPTALLLSLPFLGLATKIVLQTRESPSQVPPLALLLYTYGLARGVAAVEALREPRDERPPPRCRERRLS